MFNFLKLQQKNNHQYPLMRDPQRNPKCYEMTDVERLAALARSDKLLKQSMERHASGYYGA